MPLRHPGRTVRRPCEEIRQLGGEAIWISARGDPLLHRQIAPTRGPWQHNIEFVQIREEGSWAMPHRIHCAPE